MFYKDVYAYVHASAYVYVCKCSMYVLMPSDILQACVPCKTPSSQSCPIRDYIEMPPGSPNVLTGSSVHRMQATTW